MKAWANYFKEEFSIIQCNDKTFQIKTWPYFITSTLITFLCAHWYFPLIRMDYNSSCFEFVDPIRNQSGLCPHIIIITFLVVTTFVSCRIFNFLEICLEIIVCPPQPPTVEKLTRSTRRSYVYISWKTGRS